VDIKVNKLLKKNNEISFCCLKEEYPFKIQNNMDNKISPSKKKKIA